MPRIPERADIEPRKKFICKHCQVPVISKTNKKAIYGREHGKHCPRRFL